MQLYLTPVRACVAPVTEVEVVTHDGKFELFHNTANGASASALVYSISETAKLNNLRPYYYFKYILTELPKHCDEKGNIDSAVLDYLMPWSESLPEECRKPHRS